MIIEGFKHIVGHHCSSSAIQSVLAFDGIELSEAMVFGLASGLGFFYLNDSDLPSRKFNGRAPDLEGNFYGMIGKGLAWAKKWDLELIKNSLANNRPIIAQTDIFPIPYYDDVHFIGHGLLIVGSKDDNLTVADIASADLLELPIDSFKAAIEKDCYPLLQAYSYAQVPVVDSIDIEALLPRAIKKTCLYMLEPPSANEGLSGMKLMTQEITDWSRQKDAAFIARFGYQAIEKRGTGGGNFRLLFSHFLEQSQAYLDIDTATINGFKKSAVLWSAFAQELKAAAFSSQTDLERILYHAKTQLSEIEALEKTLFSELLHEIQ